MRISCNCYLRRQTTQLHGAIQLGQGTVRQKVRPADRSEGCEQADTQEKRNPAPPWKIGTRTNGGYCRRSHGGLSILRPAALQDNRPIWLRFLGNRELPRLTAENPASRMVELENEIEFHFQDWR